MSTEAVDSILTQVVARSHESHAFPPPALPLRVLITAENASFRFGGEAILPLHYFRLLRSRGIPVWMITNQRNQAELAGRLSPDDLNHIHFVPDGLLHRRLDALSRILPQSLFSFTAGQLIHILDQLRARPLARTLIAQHRITLLHQPTPVSPKHVSVLSGLPVPVVIGPMNGGINYPPAFLHREQLIDRLFVPLGRALAGLVNRLLPGKLNAATLIVANHRTARALPPGVRGKIEFLVENGVDLDVYRHASTSSPAPGNDPAPVTRFAFAGRLIGWKGVDLLLDAAKIARGHVPLHLDILGDGPWRTRLIRHAQALEIGDLVTFHGWMSHDACARIFAGSDVLVLPSLRECGGAAVLEAMAMRLPVIATRWGGPADYIVPPDAATPAQPATGILIDPKSPAKFVADLASAMVHLAQNPQIRAAMGAAGYQRVLTEFDWERKMDAVLAIYKDALRRHAARYGRLSTTA